MLIYHDYMVCKWEQNKHENAFAYSTMADVSPCSIRPTVCLGAAGKVWRTFLAVYRNTALPRLLLSLRSQEHV